MLSKLVEIKRNLGIISGILQTGVTEFLSLLCVLFCCFIVWVGFLFGGFFTVRYTVFFMVSHLVSSVYTARCLSAVFVS